MNITLKEILTSIYGHHSPRIFHSLVGIVYICGSKKVNGMMRRYITALMLACCIGGYGQEKKQVTFVPPFDFPLTLSGNFGEIRSNHFHGGLDFKTGGVIGKTRSCSR